MLTPSSGSTTSRSASSISSMRATSDVDGTAVAASDTGASDATMVLEPVAGDDPAPVAGDEAPAPSRRSRRTTAAPTEPVGRLDPDDPEGDPRP